MIPDTGNSFDPLASLPLLGADHGSVLKGTRAKTASTAIFDLLLVSRAKLSILVLRKLARGTLLAVRNLGPRYAVLVWRGAWVSAGQPVYTTQQLRNSVHEVDNELQRS
eukprot:13511274-Heterocapsa_arctica.AAC.1